MKIRRFLLLLIIFLFFLSPNSAQSPTAKVNNTTDQQSLLAFKSYISHDPYKGLSSWNSSYPFCSWKGVTCNITKQRVTSLDLTDLALQGSVAPHLGNLSFLSSLYLQNNKLSGNLPSEIGKLVHLQTLNLNSNLLRGTIPESLGLCSGLISLDLSSNNLEGWIPSEIGQLKELDALILSDNFLTGPIPRSLGNLSLLVNLQLGLNEIFGEIPPSIFNISSLTQLVLAGNYNLSGTLPSDMFLTLPNLNTLFVGGNKFSGPLPVSLGNASNLVYADFSMNNFSGQIPSLRNLVSIQILNFEINQLVSRGERGWDFLDSLSTATQLRVFSLGRNLLTGSLPSTIGSLPRQLSQLVMGHNFLEGNLPTEISNLVNLNILSLEYNYLNDTIPDSLGTLPMLQILYLHNNYFSGKVPSSLGELQVLSELKLRSNFLTGPIPSSLGNLHHLQVLDLSVNMLDGAIPVEIFNIPNFSTVLNLSFNSLAGHIPQEIGMLRMIQAIDVANNQLSGEIPSTIGDCSNLLYLNMSRNSFQGPIPSNITISSISIDLSSNQLSGEIPTYLQYLFLLEVLDLSMNQLQGSVPMRGIFSDGTSVSLSGNPELCGGLPQLKLPECNFQHKKHSRRLVILGLAGGIFAALILTGSIFFLLISKRKSLRRQPYDPAAAVSPSDVGQHKFYTYYSIKSATNDFSAENLVGEGSFGTVYRGNFGDGRLAAIKVFKMEENGASKSFISECEALRNVRHRNLVKIISVCSSLEFKALILPYMSNGSLGDWLHRADERGVAMKMWHRLRLATDVASAIEYLHHDCETPIVHRDLKPSNVLLDEDMRARVGDFGIAKILIDDSPSSRSYTSRSTLGLKGSIGYIAPEYGFGGRVSTKGDVYSYGILLLELFTGKKPTAEEFTDNLNLQRWVFEGLPDRVTEILDPKFIRTAWMLEHQEDIVAILQLGLRCARKSPEERPTMREVCFLLYKQCSYLYTMLTEIC